MECLLQYLDELDDIVYVFALTWEKTRLLFNLALSVMIVIAVLACGIYAAMINPPLAVASGSLLIVTLLYWGTVGRSALAQPAA